MIHETTSKLQDSKIILLESADTHSDNMPSSGYLYSAKTKITMVY